jgi:hypothetical protein
MVGVIVSTNFLKQFSCLHVPTPLSHNLVSLPIEEELQVVGVQDVIFVGIQQIE